MASIAAPASIAQTVQSGKVSAPGASPAPGALGKLSSNFGDFLHLLMVQLKNQDPTAPMDANQFTSELVQFSSVEQQIATNTSLTQLIQLTQTADVTQSSSVVGKQVTVQAPQVALQKGSAKLGFTAPAGQNVSVSVLDASGKTLRQVAIKAQTGDNTWTWDGKSDTGQTVPDGAYTVAVTGGPAGSPAQALPFTVTGTATGVQVANNTVNLQIGGLIVPFSAIRSVGD